MRAFMTRFFALTTAVLALIVGVLVGVLVSVPRSAQPAPVAAATAATTREGAPETTEVVDTRPVPNGALNFADIAARLNPAVVNIDATARGQKAGRLLEESARPGGLDDPYNPGRRNTDTPRRGTGTGFLIDPEGNI